MKLTRRFLPLLLILLPASTLSAQQQGGNLAPPGAPAVSMKSLAEIDPGTALEPADFGATGITISAPGYYYLTGNVTTVPATEDAITISSANVTLDLRGFAIIANGGSGTSPSDSAIWISSSAFAGVTVRNGIVSGAFDAGFYSNSADSCTCENLRVIGTKSYGIYMGENAQVINCTVGGTTSTGLISTAGILTSNFCLVKDCTVGRCDGVGISVIAGTSILDCTSYDNGGGGFDAGDLAIFDHCAANENTGDGINAGIGAVVDGCTASRNSVNGIDVGDGAAIRGCSAFDNGNDGIQALKGATITACSSRQNTGDGFETSNGPTISQCSAYDNSEVGYRLSTGCVITASSAYNNVLSGFAASTGSMIAHCSSYDNGQQEGGSSSSNGFSVSYGSKVVDCTAYNNKGDGIHAPNFCSIQDNVCYLNNNGISANSSNLVRGNMCANNTTGNYSHSGGDIGPIELGSTGTSPNANFE
jgi:hypothetical protein